MYRFSTIFLLFFLFHFFTLNLCAQEVDTLDLLKTTVDTLPPDTVIAVKSVQPVDDGSTPDTVYLINGDRFTGDILTYEMGRLKFDAQGTGIVNIKSQKILSINGGNRKFKVEDKRKELYVGSIHYSKDTGEIILESQITYGILLEDIELIQPVESKKDSVLPVPSTEVEKNKKTVYVHSPDTVFLKTGDQITGKIVSFEQGRLKIDAQSAGVISIKWYKIAFIEGGSRMFKVEDQAGQINIGYIELSKDTGDVDIVNNSRHAVLLEDIVRIFPLEEEWYRGFKGSMGGGLNYTKSSEVLSINLDYNLYYVISKWRFINNFSYIETSSKNEDRSLRVSLDLEALYALPDKWVLSEINAFNRNDELGIDSRISFGLGGGNNIVQTEKQRLLLLTGIVQNSEKSIESSDVTSSFEWPFSISHTVYSFISPNLTSTTKGSSFVGITEKGRFRVDASTDLTYEFIKNVKFKLSVYYSFDNKVVEGKTSQEDYGTVLSLLFDLK